MPASPEPLVLAFDTASPRVSVAVAGPGRLLAERDVELGHSSRELLGLVEEALREAGCRLADLAGVLALAGPGSFTGLRVGFATAMGLHQATGVPATALPTLPALAAAVLAARPEPAGTSERPLAAVVDARRGEWVAQRFVRGESDGWPRALGEPERLPAADLARLAPAVVAGFGAGALAGVPEIATADLDLVEPPSLAPAAALAAAAAPPEWDPAALTRPIYFRPPAVTPATARTRSGEPR